MGSSTTNTTRISQPIFSETQKRKVHHLFDVLDINRNGQLEPDDFVNVGRKIIAQLDLDQNSRSARVILLKAYRLFVQLLADQENPEMSLTLWDWVEFFRNQIESPNGKILKYYIYRTSRHIFDLFDMDKDNRISRQEYANMLKSYNIPQNTAIEGFNELDTNRDNFISVEEMIEGLKNFFNSDQSNARGNMIFGDWR